MENAIKKKKLIKRWQKISIPVFSMFTVVVYVWRQKIEEQTNTFSKKKQIIQSGECVIRENTQSNSIFIMGYGWD